MSDWRAVERYVAIGDSSTEGLLDVDERGELRGWSFRLAERIARARGGLLYANLAARGATTRQIGTSQLRRALAMKPDLVTVFSGTNDVLQRRFDLSAFTIDVFRIHDELRRTGAIVLTFTLPDLTPLVPLARRIAPRIRAMNDAVRAVCIANGSRLLDFAALPVATDARLWDEDRLHANPAGHARISDALAQSLGLPGTNDDWRQPLPALPSPGLAAAAWRELRWYVRHCLPWALQGTFPRSGGVPYPGRRPELEPIR